MGAAPCPARTAGWRSGKAAGSTEEKHPLYYRPWKRLRQVQDSLTLDVFIFSKGKEKKGTKRTNPTHGSLVLENTRPCWQRDAVGERGTSRERGTTLPPANAARGCRYVTPACTQQPHPYPLPARAVAPGGISAWNVVVPKETGEMHEAGAQVWLYSSPRSAAMGSLVHFSLSSWDSV